MKEVDLQKADLSEAIVAYSLPGTTEYLLTTVTEIVKGDENADLMDYDFVFSPFSREDHPQLLFKFSSWASGRKFEAAPLVNFNATETSPNEYVELYNSALNLISSKELRKLVVFRTKYIDRTVEDLYPYFIALKNAYPSAFTYLIQVDGLGTWLGASPELLLSQNVDGFLSRAIAGTKPANLNSSWSEKEIEEHHFVEQHYNDVLSSAGVDLSISDSYTIDTSIVHHLCSDIQINADQSALEDIIAVIHPSPALSGYPVNAAVENLKRLETHSRKYYCGYLGPIEKDQLSLFANIRCMEAFTNGFCLYLGGGLTGDSELEAEWNETELKAKTLESIIAEVKTSVTA